MRGLQYNGAGYYDPTAYQAIANVQKEQKGKTMEVYRGDIYYVKKNGVTTGSEQDSYRPAVIVSNDTGNKHSSVVEIVYLTTQEKKPLPTHCTINAKVPSTAICEQISNVSKERLAEFVRTCTDEEMARIDRCLMISLGLCDVPDPTATIDNGLIDDLTMKLEGAERKLDELNAENAGLLLENGDLKEKLKNAEKKIPVFPVETEKELLKAETQRDMYKELYEQMLDRMIG